ncbi:hypothetical protein BGP77_11650 [Saccharospirillum sp. MSK14-1]|nr:hypothetical protein BGP77_11650 [Saccharospirillum sp. MSK14-1]
MLKVAGNRINPLEIEEVVNELEFVLESAVIGEADEIFGQRVICFVVGMRSAENELRIKKHCSDVLSDYKVPRKLFWLEEIPKTASGKIQRYRLTKEMESQHG